MNIVIAYYAKLSHMEEEEMLCQFAFENFKSFKNEAFLDFCAEPISDNKESLIIDSDGEKFLPVVSIYQPMVGVNLLF